MSPPLSIVVTTRNDNHGGLLRARFQSFLDHLGDMCERHRLDCELIVVEWNPPADQPALCKAMRWPQVPSLQVRIIVVPPAIHHSLTHSECFPLFQMIAKNVGIRRARGEWVLATNIDVLFSEELTAWLGRGELNPACFYRLDRYDLAHASIPESLTCEERLQFCAEGIIRVHGQHGSYPWGETPKTGDPNKLHTNACGDFTLMARSRWLELKGYPELELWSIYIDGLLLHAAAAVGLQQVILADPCCVYHIEHETGWAVIQNTIQDRPSLDYHKQYLPWCRHMLDSGQPLAINGEDWGYADQGFDEMRPSSWRVEKGA